MCVVRVLAYLFKNRLSITNADTNTITITNTFVCTCVAQLRIHLAFQIQIQIQIFDKFRFSRQQCHQAGTMKGDHYQWPHSSFIFSDLLLKSSHPWRKVSHDQSWVKKIPGWGSKYYQSTLLPLCESFASRMKGWICETWSKKAKVQTIALLQHVSFHHRFNPKKWNTTEHNRFDLFDTARQCPGQWSKASSATCWVASQS